MVPAVSVRVVVFPVILVGLALVVLVEFHVLEATRLVL